MRGKLIPSIIIACFVALLSVLGWSAADRIQMESRVTENTTRIENVENWIQSVDARLERMERKLDRALH